MKRRKIFNINEIFNGTDLLIKDFTNLDLSNLNLSDIPIEKWEGCVFHNTNFKNTGIKFIPNKLGRISRNDLKIFDLFPWLPIFLSMINCDFSDNDLSYLQIADFYIGENNEICTYGCNFSNTGIRCLKTLRNVTLDSSYANYDFDDNYWHFKYGTVNWPDYIDIDTIIKNPFLKVPSFRILNAIYYYVRKTNNQNNITQGYKFDEAGKIIYGISGGDLEYKGNLVQKCEELLIYDKQGYGKKLYQKLSPFMSIEQKFEFFSFSIRNLHIKDINFEDIPIEVLRYYEIYNNKLENITLNSSMDSLLHLWSEHIIDTIPSFANEYHNFCLPNINYSSWQENDNAKRRVSDSAITFFTKAYIELSRECNANCIFCRNNSFEYCQYNLENIIATINNIKGYLNAAVIGGGEPTLRLEDVKILREYFKSDKIDWHLFTNGTLPEIIDDNYIMDNFKINLSRHSSVDRENASIFQINPSKIMTTYDIEILATKTDVTLNATCFKEGLDSFKKIMDYIDYARRVGCKKVLIQNLQKPISLGDKIMYAEDLTINPVVFDEIIQYLIIKGYKQKFPIYASGGYVTYVFKNKDDFTISLQKYITKEQLDIEWQKAIKRTFDLSIDPSGNLFENWNQTYGLVRSLKKK